MHVFVEQSYSKLSIIESDNRCDFFRVVFGSDALSTIITRSRLGSHRLCCLSNPLAVHLAKLGLTHAIDYKP